MVQVGADRVLVVGDDGTPAGVLTLTRATELLQP
jgi:hypothetical protein